MVTQSEMSNSLLNKAAIRRFFLLLFFLVASVFSVNVYADELKIKTVIVEGYGTDVPSAAQNAAQNALSQVVGSFIDSNKLLEKQVEIREGVRSQVKSITTNIKEYSQGSIKSFDVIKVGEQSGLTTVSAKVVVRIDDFKKYIEEIVGGEKKIDGTGLFAQAAAKTKQYENKTQILIENVIEPLIKGGVIRFEISAPMAFDSHGELANRGVKQMSDSYGSENLYVFDVTATIDNDFMANITKSIEAIASTRKKVRIADLTKGDTYSTIEMQPIIIDAAGYDDFLIIIHDGNSSKIVAFPADLYVLSDVVSRLKKSGELGLSFTRYTGPPVKNLMIQLIGESGDVLQEGLAGTGPVLALSSDKYGSRDGFHTAWQMYTALYNHYLASQPGLGILKKREFKLVMAINQEALSKAKKIVLKLCD